MKRIELTKEHLCYEDDDSHVCKVTEFTNYIDNNGRIPMHSFDNSQTVPQVLSNLYNKSISIFEDILHEDELGEYLIISGKFISVLSTLSGSIKIAEIGASSGILSYYLAELTGIMNRESLLCLLCDEIGSGSKNYSRDYLGNVSVMPRMSVVASSYDDTLLDTNGFDIVFLNGSEYFDKPFEIIKEAERMLRENGYLFCYIKDNTILRNAFRLAFENCDEYHFSDTSELLFVRYNSKISWRGQVPESIDLLIEKLIFDIKSEIKSRKKTSELGCFSEIADELADRAVKEKNTEAKIKLLSIKEALLNYILNDNDEFDEFYYDKLSMQVGL